MGVNYRLAKNRSRAIVKKKSREPATVESSRSFHVPTGRGSRSSLAASSQGTPRTSSCRGTHSILGSPHNSTAKHPNRRRHSRQSAHSVVACIATIRPRHKANLGTKYAAPMPPSHSMALGRYEATGHFEAAGVPQAAGVSQAAGRQILAGGVNPRNKIRPTAPGDSRRGDYSGADCRRDDADREHRARRLHRPVLRLRETPR